jgi:CheY-like chemotaxis protein
MTPEQPATLLLADDDEGHRILIEENLRAAGVTQPLIAFDDGRELLDFLHGLHPRHRFDPSRQYLALLDIRMPRMDGIETLRRIRGDARLKRLPVIMLTTTDDSREIGRAYELGCSCYLAKPVDFSKFTEAMQRLGQFIQYMEIPSLAA